MKLVPQLLAVNHKGFNSLSLKSRFLRFFWGTKHLFIGVGRKSLPTSPLVPRQRKVVQNHQKPLNLIYVAWAVAQSLIGTHLVRARKLITIASGTNRPARYLRGLVGDSERGNTLILQRLQILHSVLPELWLWDGMGWDGMGMGERSDTYSEHGEPVSPRRIIPLRI